jgi:hypothetical protein
MSLTKLFLARNNLIIPGQKEMVSDIPAGNGKIIKLFYSVQYIIAANVRSVPANLDGILEEPVYFAISKKPPCDDSAITKRIQSLS